MLLAVCYWIVDLQGWSAWGKPFLVFGRNAILAYALAAIVAEVSIDFEFHDAHQRLRTVHGWIYQKYFVPHARPEIASLAFGVFFVLAIFALLWPLHQRKIFIRI
jgi:predicted acyltransferase